MLLWLPRAAEKLGTETGGLVSIRIIRLSIHSFHKYLLSSCYMPSTVLCTKKRGMNKTGKTDNEQAK